MRLDKRALGLLVAVIVGASALAVYKPAVVEEEEIIIPEPVIHPIEVPSIEVEEVYRVTAKCYDEESLYWLSRVIYAEAGSNSDELQLAVGSVVLNRVLSDIYPNTIKEVIFDKNPTVQYGCINNGMIYLQPDDRAIENAIYLLEVGPTIPTDVLAQCNTVVWGNHYKTIEGVVFSRYVRTN